MVFALIVPLLSAVSPCKGDTPAHAAAEKALRRVAVRIEALDAGADPKPVWKELEALRDLPCFEGANENSRLPEPDSALAMKTWWTSGGESWMRGYLDAPGGPRRMVSPPDVRASLTKENARAKELASLVCPAADEACGKETRGWARRARQAFRLHAFENGRAHKPEHGSDSLSPPRDCLSGGPSSETAIDRASAASEEPERGGSPKGDQARIERWSRWRGCVESGRDKTAALPVGHVRAPIEGSLVVRGRRGHYQFCDEVRVYDLATGAAWIAQSCSGLVLNDDGSVDGAATDASRRPKARAGRVSLDAIRETAWMTLLIPYVEAEVLEYAEWIDIPAGLEPQWPDPDDGGMVTGGLGMGFWMSSAQTQLAVTWKRTGAAPVERSLTYPDSANAAEDHAVTLLGIADDSFVEGCPPASLPATFAAKAAAPSVGSLDAPRGTAVTQDTLVQVLLEMPPCANSP